MLQSSISIVHDATNSWIFFILEMCFFYPWKSQKFQKIPEFREKWKHCTKFTYSWTCQRKKCCVKLCLDQKFITAKSIRTSGVARIFLIGGMEALLLLFSWGCIRFPLSILFHIKHDFVGGGGTQCQGGLSNLWRAHDTQGGTRHSAPPPPP